MANKTTEQLAQASLETCTSAHTVAPVPKTDDQIKNQVCSSLPLSSTADFSDAMAQIST
eukprot:CAMPEP_0204002546 /NCGR_PEP_ID=MMETSP0360-20130528/16988_1 /ASSEMBLY_ACC=CAM_ASM_000342 /TAXON_ID=268821 /ORGANISM="Scrippsiella Hangoei, Strain SHTV-5" /LENGTH=58 /DNA_ID=CAMNT_0050944169 /DNA_START=54 /DNA_END=226 /DNA_ORIENTATION=+